MAGLRITVGGNFGPTGWVTGEALARQEFVQGADNAFVFDAKYPSALWQDRDGTIPVTELGDPVMRIDDRSGQGRNAILRDTATSVPVWAGEGDKRWIDIPIGAGFLVDNPLLTDDWSVVAAVRLSGVSGGSNAHILCQNGAANNGFLALQISRSTGKLGVNIMPTSGYEVLSAQNMDFGTDYVAEIYKNISDTPNHAQVRMNGIDGDVYEDTFHEITTPARPTTGVFCSPDTDATTSGRLYYLAYTRAIRSTTALAAIAQSRV